MSSAKRQRHNEHRHQGHEQAQGEGPNESQSQRHRESRGGKPQQALEPTHYARIAAIAIGGIILIAFVYNLINDSVGAGLVMLGFFAIYGLFVAIGVKWWRQQKDLSGG
jgi:hypothetical protein